jgi:arginyl-tRNA synthetase
VIREQLVESLRTALAAVGVEPLPTAITLERPARPEHGDWSTNVALASSRAVGRKPRELAEDVAAHLNAEPPAHVAQVAVAGPGFVNFHLRPTWLHDVLRQVLSEGEDRYARHSLGQGRRVNVEFVSANPTGPLHVGGGRWAAYGDSL